MNLRTPCALTEKRTVSLSSVSLDAPARVIASVERPFDEVSPGKFRHGGFEFGVLICRAIWTKEYGTIGSVSGRFAEFFSRESESLIRA